MLYTILKKHLGNGRELTLLQQSTWQKTFNTAENSPKDLTPLQAFQVGRLTQKAIELNKQINTPESEEIIKFLEGLQTKIKFAL